MIKNIIKFILRRISETLFDLIGIKIVKLNINNKKLFYKHDSSRQVLNIGELQELYFGRIFEGFFVEVGAFDGKSFGAVWGLANKGWSGLLIEPSALNIEKIRRNYSDLPKIRIIKAAVADVTGKTYLWNDGALSKLTNASPEAIEVDQFTLDEILRINKVNPGFEFLSIDTEGCEKNVLEGFSLDFFKPKMICIEIMDASLTEIKRNTYYSEIYREFYKNKDYVVIYKDWINTVFVRSDLYLGLRTFQ